LRGHLAELRKLNETHTYVALLDLALQREGEFEGIDTRNLKLIDSAGRLILYGAGHWCRVFLDFFDMLDMRYPDEIWDINADNMSPRLNAVPVRLPDFTTLQNTDVLVVSVEGRDIGKQVIAQAAGKAFVLKNEELRAVLAHSILDQKKKALPRDAV
jgi:hypothetical protein